jgi:hypothetical protein
MATNLAISPKLLDFAYSIGGQKTKKDTVNQALKEYIQRRKVVDLIDAFGTVDYDSDYDYKTLRAGR